MLLLILQLPLWECYLRGGVAKLVLDGVVGNYDGDVAGDKGCADDTLMMLMMMTMMMMTMVTIMMMMVMMMMMLMAMTMMMMEMVMMMMR